MLVRCSQCKYQADSIHFSSDELSKWRAGVVNKGVVSGPFDRDAQFFTLCPDCFPNVLPFLSESKNEA